MDTQDKDKQQPTPTTPTPRAAAAKQAHLQAEKDIEQDADTKLPDKGDDLDEGELARLDNSND